MFLVGDFSFEGLPKDEQLLLVPIVTRTLRMTGLGECIVGPLHPKDEEVTEVRLRYAGFREGDQVDSCLTYTNSLRSPKPIVELGKENALGLISWSLFVGGRVTYPPFDEVLMSLQVPPHEGLGQMRE